MPELATIQVNKQLLISWRCFIMCKKQVLLVSLVLVLGLTLPATAQTNVLFNHGFEDGTWENEQSTPDHWWRRNFGGWGLDWKQDPAGSHSGAYHVNSYGDTGSEMWWGQDVHSFTFRAQELLAHSSPPPPLKHCPDHDSPFFVFYRLPFASHSLPCTFYTFHARQKRAW